MSAEHIVNFLPSPSWMDRFRYSYAVGTYLKVAGCHPADEVSL